MENWLYSKKHIWIEKIGNEAKIGISDYAQEQLGSIMFINLPDVNDKLEVGADGDVLPLLFAIDETFDISIKDLDGEPGIFFSNKNLVQFLKDWQAMKELLDNGSQTQDNYEIWKTIRPSVTKVTHE